MIASTYGQWKFKITKLTSITSKEKNNILADMLNRLITVDWEVELNPKFMNYEFGQYYFEEIPKARTKEDQN